MQIPLSGGCFCGALRYTLSAQPYGQANCHCRACQHATGGAFAGVVLVPTEALELKGEYTEYTAPGDSGHPVSRGFCPRCGTTVFAHTARIESMRPVYASTLDQPEQFAPSLDAWVDFAQPWVLMDPALAKYPRDLPAECAGLPAPKNRKRRGQE
ncbi:hypothetical protein A9Q89_00120 [Gammaproteobacteria bacterium 53_120_T64]|nr:hypothetical protein A9Q89_00120 [Gammaproteobacteria bacterium 53_120_T64]